MSRHTVWFRGGRRKHLLCFLIGILLLGFPVSFRAAADNPSLDDQLFSVDIPITYGEDFFRQRIAERTEGQRPAVGLVLSGGSARAFAHIGVLEYLEEQRIVPDFIISNSMGSIVGLLYGAGFSPEQIYRLLRAGEDSSLFSLALPLRGGVLDSSGFVDLIAPAVGDIRLEELPIPVMVTGEDLKTKRQIRMAEGDFLTVLQASYALPFYFDPVQYKNHLVVDGGFTNLVPLEEAVLYGDEIIVATAFYQNPDLNLRNPLTALNVAIDISKTRRGIEHMKLYDHILIRSKVEHFSFMEFDRIDEIRQAGYDSAREQFPIDSFPLAGNGNTRTAGVGEELQLLREEIDRRLEAIESSLGTDGSIPAHRFSWMITPTIRFPNDPSIRRYLAEDLFFSLDYRAKYRTLQGILSAGTVWNPEAGTVNPAAAGQVSFFLGPYVRAEGGARYLLGDNVHAHGLAETSVSLPADMTGFIGSSIEAVWEELGEPDQSAFTAWVGAFGTLTDALRFHIETGGQWREFTNWHVYYDGTTRLIPWDLVELSHRYLRKHSLDNAPVPAYNRDRVLLATEASDNNISIHTWRAGYRFSEFRPTIGEIIIIKDMYTGVFAETQFSGGSALAAGISVGADVSLIGLEGVTLFADLGYNFYSSEFTGAVYFGK